MGRDYVGIMAALRDVVVPDCDLQQRMQNVVDVLWERLSPRGVSWVGFYLHGPTDDQMTLGPSRDQPACSPIGLHGACGQAFLTNAALVVHDVRELGGNYIACDPRDQSEVVLPIHEATGRAIGVLDLDSHQVGAFDEHDVAGLTRVLRSAGLQTQPGAPHPS